jgi:hypothetical protein
MQTNSKMQRPPLRLNSDFSLSRNSIYLMESTDSNHCPFLPSANEPFLLLKLMLASNSHDDLVQSTEYIK